MGFLVPAVTAGASIIGGLLGGKKSKEQKTLETEQAANIRDQRAQAAEKFNLAKGFLPKIDTFFDQASKGYTSARDYYQQLARGGPAAINALIGPQRGALNREFSSVVGNLLNRGPRGGGTNQLLAGMDAQRTGRLLDLILNARPEGTRGLLASSQALEGIGQNYGNLGLGFSGSSAASLGGAQQGIAGLLKTEMASSQRRGQTLAGIGAAVADLVKELDTKYGWSK
jgi:hypothetical protein